MLLLGPDELTTANSEITRLESEDIENKAVLDKLRSELEEARLTIAARDEKITMLEKRLTDERNQALKEKQTLVEQMETQRGKMGELEKSAASLEAKLSAVQDERNRLTTLFETLGKKDQPEPKKDRPADELKLDG